MPIKTVKDLIVWQRAMELVREIYGITKALPQFEVYGLANQMRRAAVSIPTNIAEGKNRKTRKEFTMYLRISSGSSAELETLLIITRDAYPNNNYLRAETLVTEVKKMLATIIRKLDEQQN